MLSLIVICGTAYDFYLVGLTLNTPASVSTYSMLVDKQSKDHNAETDPSPFQYTITFTIKFKDPSNYEKCEGAIQQYYTLLNFESHVTIIPSITCFIVFHFTPEEQRRIYNFITTGNYSLGAMFFMRKDLHDDLQALIITSDYNNTLFYLTDDINYKKYTDHLLAEIADPSLQAQIFYNPQQILITKKKPLVETIIHKAVREYMSYINFGTNPSI